MKEMEQSSQLSTVYVGNDKVSVDDVGKQKSANNYDDNLFEEEVQLKSEL